MKKYSGGDSRLVELGQIARSHDCVVLDTCAILSYAPANSPDAFGGDECEVQNISTIYDLVENHNNIVITDGVMEELLEWNFYLARDMKNPVIGNKKRLKAEQRYGAISKLVEKMDDSGLVKKVSNFELHQDILDLDYHQTALSDVDASLFNAAYVTHLAGYKTAIVSNDGGILKATGEIHRAKRLNPENFMSFIRRTRDGRCSPASL